MKLGESWKPAGRSGGCMSLSVELIRFNEVPEDAPKLVSNFAQLLFDADCDRRG